LWVQQGQHSVDSQTDIGGMEKYLDRCDDWMGSFGHDSQINRTTPTHFHLLFDGHKPTRGDHIILDNVAFHRSKQ
jgi:hypothetical protein